MRSSHALLASTASRTQRPWRSRNAPRSGARDGGVYGFDLGKTRREIFLSRGLDR